MRYSSGAGSGGSDSSTLAGTVGSGSFSGYFALTLNGTAPVAGASSFSTALVSRASSPFSSEATRRRNTGRAAGVKMSPCFASVRAACTLAARAVFVAEILAGSAVS